jgi:flagellar biosynthesis protein FlhF
MKLRTFTADDMQLAMHMVREALGDDAIIISTKQTDKKGAVQVIAAADTHSESSKDVQEDAAWFAALRGTELADARLEIQGNDNMPTELPAEKSVRMSHGNIPLRIAQTIEMLLRHHGVTDAALRIILEQLDGLGVQDAERFSYHPKSEERWFAALMAAVFPMSPLNIRSDSARHILIGAQGAGKTLTTAKIAAHCVKYNQPVHVITVDNKKAGGVEQLAAITDILGIELQVAESRLSLKSMLSEIPLAETVIVDSAGANPYDFYELKEVAEYASLIELDPVLVYAAGGDPQEAEECARAFSFVGVEKMIITRIDTARRFGSILNAAAATGVKIANVTGTEKILGAFDPCTPDLLTKLFFDYNIPHV